MWRQFLAVLTWLAAEPRAVDLERPRAAAAVAYAYAAQGPAEEAPAPPAPAECACGGTCVDGLYKPDGRIVERCPCGEFCACKRR